MNITLLYRSKKVRFAHSMQVRKLVPAAVLACVAMLMSSRSVQTVDQTLNRVDYARSGNLQQQTQIEQLKQSTQQQLAGMMLKLAKIEGQLQKIDALGQKLVAQAELDQAEFSFNQTASDDLPDGQQYYAQLNENELITQIDHMLYILQNKNRELQALENIMLGHHIQQQSVLSGRPIKKGWLSSYYGVRKDPFNGLPTMHKGLDFAGVAGEAVIATGAGVVTWAGRRYGYGQLVEIEHGNGLTTRYAHNQELQVKVGDVVTKGQSVALMGNTGRSTGAHVHYEVLRHGEQQDPLPYVYRK